MLLITPHDLVKLPYDFHFSHNLSVRLYDNLVSILKDDKINKKIEVKFKLEEGMKPPNNEEHILDWLKKNRQM